MKSSKELQKEPHVEILLEFDALFFKIDTPLEKILEFIKAKVMTQPRAFRDAIQKNGILHSYCDHKKLKPFWDDLKRKRAEQENHTDNRLEVKKASF